MLRFVLFEMYIKCFNVQVKLVAYVDPRLLIICSTYKMFGLLPIIIINKGFSPRFCDTFFGIYVCV